MTRVDCIDQPLIVASEALASYREGPANPIWNGIVFMGMNYFRIWNGFVRIITYGLRTLICKIVMWLGGDHILCRMWNLQAQAYHKLDFKQERIGASYKTDVFVVLVPMSQNIYKLI